MIFCIWIWSVVEMGLAVALLVESNEIFTVVLVGFIGLIFVHGLK